MKTSSKRDNNIVLIIQIMLFIDEHLLKKMKLTKKTAGRKSKLILLELLTILVYDGITERHQTKRGIYNYIKREYSDCFQMPSYANFSVACQKAIRVLGKCLKALLKEAAVAFLDSTPLKVCEQIRVKSYNTLDKRSVGFIKNLMGWFFGFKLHLGVDADGNILSFHISKGNYHDRRGALKLVNPEIEKIAGDQHYGGRPLVEELSTLGIEVVSNAKTNLGQEEKALLRQRSIVETVFSVLKNRYKMATNYPKSKAGYTFHYLRILLAYQMNRYFSQDALINY